MISLVIDTNVFVAGLRSAGGASRMVLRRVLEGKFQALFGNALWSEYQDLLGRPVWGEGTNADERQQVLAALARQFGGAREAAVALELTKRFERVRRGTLAALAEEFKDAETKGEAVVVVAGAEERVIEVSEWRPALAELLKTQPLRGAVDDVAARYGLKRKEVYDAALALRQAE